MFQLYDNNFKGHKHILSKNYEAMIEVRLYLKLYWSLTFEKSLIINNLEVFKLHIVSLYLGVIVVIQNSFTPKKQEEQETKLLWFYKVQSSFSLEFGEWFGSTSIGEALR